jgi:signal transduction histidine kinase
MVDDNATSLVALESVLGSLGHELVSARSGEEALRQVTLRHFAVILMDAHMPVLDGFETVRLIKERESTRHVPIIFLTGFDDSTLHIARGYGLGAVDYLIKPIDPYVLRCKVEVFVELHVQRAMNRRNAELLHAEQLARAAAEAGIRAREDILGIVSHEMGSPVSSIELYAKLIADRGRASGDDKIVEYAARQHGAGKRLERMVADLLDASRIESGRLSLNQEECTVLSIVDSVVNELSPIAANKAQNLAVSVSPELSVSCDRDRISQVLANLIGNALKFAHDGSTVQIEAVSATREIIVTVRDDGPGISDADLACIFEPYWQAAAGKKQRGLGLGLAIANGIIQAHGGRIWVESTLGSGSAFHFSLSNAPARLPKHQDTAPRRAS